MTEAPPATDPHRLDTELVERLTYLASLASDRQAIDESLDKLRLITSTWDQQRGLTMDNRDTLLGLEAQIKNYLVHKDSLRAFSEQELEERLIAHKQELEQAPKRPLFNFWLINLASLFVAGVAVLPLVNMSLPDRAFMAALVFMMLLTIWDVWLYLSSLGNFKPGLRKAFGILCFGVILMGITFTHFALLAFSGYLEKPLFMYGGFTPLAFISLTPIYLGIRRYAQLVSVSSRFMSLPIYALCSLLISVPGVVYALSSDAEYPWFLALTLTGTSSAIICCVFSAALANRIRNNVTAAYAQSMQWLYVFHVAGFFGAAGFSIALAVLAGISANTLGLFLGAAGILPILALTYSGYAFKKETTK